MMNAGKMRDTWVHAITTSLFANDDDEPRGGGVGGGGGAGPQRRRLLVVINPMSGTKDAMTVATRTLLPILHEAGMDYEILITQHQGQAQQVRRTKTKD